MIDQRDTAIHEAGHAVMAARHDRTVGAVSIASDGATLGGSIDDTDFRLSRADAEQWVLTCLAGYAALAAIDHGDPASGADDDFEKAQEAIDLWEIGTLDMWKSKAVEIMREPRNRHAVERIAARLLRDRHIDGQLFDVLLSWADGEIDDDGLAAFEAMTAGGGIVEGEIISIRPPQPR